ncbi:uncharacterized protein BXZ73DRAFT_99036 [Epithele typhae]|uniref:uncharacterized protein n=1 Tax=Epithele typhae TaxID=378194 RepID=UPI0020077B89|nr:uncharacterized protein BXZ73DRAFT_99036 [Epithele typhae]KAH9940041.1 hypothetical protein BXZ73DRAFT_99036 [Epithele typhae]
MPVSSQPHAISTPALMVFDPTHEKAHAHDQYVQLQFAEGGHADHRRCRCNKSPARRIWTGLSLALVSFLLFLVFVALYDHFFNGGALLASCGFTEGGNSATWAAIGGFVKRQSTSDSSNGNSFVDNKLYLIVIFVGLFLVVLGGICLSAWCCKSSFQNPLCCPCYLCACCGGLACLECIGCGLCAEGFDQM